MLVNSVCTTSARPCGTTSALAALPNDRVCGKAREVSTATTADRKVVNRYRKITVPKRRSSLDAPWASALATSTNTRIGAMAFRALTNKVPNSPIHVMCGMIRARMVPAIRPTMMRMISSVPLYLSMTALAAPEICFIVFSLVFSAGVPPDRQAENHPTVTFASGKGHVHNGRHAHHEIHASPSNALDTNARDSPVTGSSNSSLRATSSNGREKSSYGRWMTSG